MLRDPAPCGRGSEGLLMGQQGRGYRSVLISIGDFHAQWRVNGRMSDSRENAWIWQRQFRLHPHLDNSPILWALAPGPQRL
jgi:hypothetical protein